MKDGFVLVYRTPAPSVAGLVPEGFDLNTRNGYAFWNIAISQVEALRPWGLPPWGGFDCAIVTCGLSVSTQTRTGKKMRGLYPVRSDADPRFLWFLGNEFLSFQTHRATIEFEQKGHRLIVTVDSQEDDQGHAYLSVDLERPVSMTLESAHFPVHPGILMSHDKWLSRIHFTEMIHDLLFPWNPVHIQEARWNLFRDLDQEQAVLETAFRIEPAEFTWRVGEYAEMQSHTTAVGI